MGAVASRGGAAPKKTADDDEPPPLVIGDDPIGLPGGPAATPGQPAPAAQDEPAAPAKKRARLAASDDPESPGYKSAGARGKAWEALEASAERDLSALKLAGGGKKDDATDLFVLQTTNIEDHEATVEYPIRKGLRQAAEFVADFMAGKSKRVFRKWDPVARAKTEKIAEAQAKIARKKSVEGKLEDFKPSKSGRKSLDDYFVVGTGELYPLKQHADVRFHVVGGTKATASLILDFVLAGSDKTKRMWNVFDRFRTQADADTFIAQLRNWYDTMEQQRSKIAAIYNAKTTRRC
jgi:hypothetical protein